MNGAVPQVHESFQQFTADLHIPREPLALVRYILSGLQTFIPSDYNSWKEIPFAKGPCVTAVFSPHNPTASSLLPAFQRHISHHPVYSYWRRTGNHAGAICWMDVSSRSDFERRDLYQEFYRPLGVTHQMLVALEVRASNLVYLALNRTRSAFTNEEGKLLTAVQTHVSSAIRQQQDVTSLRSALASFETLVNALNQGVVCFSSDNRIRWATKRARHYFQAYCGSAPQIAQLPETLIHWLGPALQKVGSPFPPRRPLTIQSQIGRLVIRLLKEKGDNYLFLEEIPAHPTFTELTTLGLTEREAEVLGWIAQGKSNDETAALLGICSQTIKKHLERIYDALGVGNRTEAALKVQTVLRHTC
jgi:ATP/maltotriose-dependent transcriptional regulator MalT